MSIIQGQSVIEPTNTACAAAAAARVTKEFARTARSSAENFGSCLDAYQLISLLLSASVLFAAAQAVLSCSG